MGAATEFCGGGPRGLRVTAQLSDLKRRVADARMVPVRRKLTALRDENGSSEQILAPLWRLRASPWWRARCDHAVDDTPILKERSQWRRP